MNTFKEKVELRKSPSLQKVASLSSVLSDEGSVSIESLEAEETEGKYVWKRLVFVQFHKLWIIILLLSIVVHAAWVIYYMAYTIQTEAVYVTWGTQHPIVEYFCDAFFLADLILAVIYKRWKTRRSISVYPTRKVAFIIVDIVCLLPTEVLFIILSAYHHSVRMFYILKCNRILRMYRVIYYFNEAHNTMGFNNFVLLITESVTYLLFLSHACSALLFVFSCTDRDNRDCLRTWAFTFEEMTQLRLTSSLDWYIMCVYIILGQLTCRSFPNILPVLASVKYLFMFCSILYLILVTGYLIGHYNSALLDEKRRIFLFSQRLSVVKQYFHSENISRDLYYTTMKFYYSFWKNRRAIGEKPLSSILPMFCRKELSLDIYWDAFKHSQIFKHMDVAFLRYVSIHMKSNYLLQGQIIYNKNSVKNKMIYVVSGVIQILSDEDDETPLISFSGGTCLGEASLVFSYMNKNIVRCASYCEISILERKAFYSIMKAYPDYRKICLKRIQKRYVKAQELNTITNLLQLDLIDFIDKPLITPIRWVKDTLQRLTHQSSKTSNKSHVSDRLYKATMSSFNDIQFTTVYLNMYVLSEELELVTDAICLKTTCPWILQPNSLLIRSWNLFIVGLVTFTAIIMPYYACFDGKYPEWIEMLVYLCQIIYICDLWIQISTAIQTKDGLISNWVQIFCLHLNEPGFLVDIFAAVPFFFFSYLIQGHSEQLFTLLTLTQLTKLWKLFYLFAKLENSLTLDVNNIRLLKYVISILFVTYFSSVALYVQTCYNRVCIPGGWNQHRLNRKLIKGPNHDLVLSFYFATMLITGIGYDDVQPTNMRDLLFVSFISFIAGFLYITMISGLSATAILTRKSRVRYQEIMKTCFLFMSEKKMDTNITQRVYNYMRTKWLYNQGATVLFGRKILFDLPRDIHNEIKNDILFELLTKVPLFQDVDESFVSKVAPIAMTHVLPRNEIVTYTGEISKAMHIIRLGYCEIVNSMTGESQNVIMGPGSHFSVVEMCLKIPVVNTVRTVTDCKFITIYYKDLVHVMSQFPYIHMEFKEITDECMKLPQLAEFRNEKPSFEFAVKESTKAAKSWKYFGYCFIKGSPKQADYMNPFLQLKRLSVLRFLLQRVCIHPGGKFIKYWELSRVFFAFVSAIIFPAQKLLETQLQSEIFEKGKWVLDATAYADLYLRLHCGYYNSKGILVTHPLRTSVHYMKHALFVDLLACLPLRIFITSDNARVLGIFQRMLFLVKVLQCYRIVRGFQFMEENIFRPAHFISIFKFFVYGVIFVNAVGSFFVLSTCIFLDSTLESNNSALYEPGVFCFNDSWIARSQFKKPMGGIYVYMYGLYWTCSTLTKAGLEGISFVTNNEALYIIGLSIFGLLANIYVYSSIVASRTSRNVELTSYQENMRNLIDFMKNKIFTVDLRNEVINYFEILWKCTGGTNAHMIFGDFHSALRGDILFHLFENSLRKCKVFKMAEISVFRSLLFHVDLRLFLKKARIIKINDVHSSLYFVHKGEVVISGPDGNQLCTLGIGSVFGNLDNVPTIRQTVTVVAKGHVEVLQISTNMFFKILNNYPNIKNRFELFTTLNTDYLDAVKEEENILHSFDDASPSQTLKANSIGVVRRANLHRKLYLSHSKFFIIFEILFVCGTLLNFIITLYQVAVQEYHIGLFIFVYFLDILYLFKICFKFHFIYEDDFGGIITDLEKMIQRHVMARPWLFVDCLSVLPLDSVTTFLGKFHWTVYLRLNRLLRIVFVLQSFHLTNNKLKMKIFFMRFCFICTFIIITLHSYSCILTALMCNRQNQQCQFDTMTHEEKATLFMHNVNIIVSMVATTSSIRMLPDTYSMFTFFIFVTMSSHIVIGILIGETCASLEIVNYTMYKYAHKVTNLKKYLKLHDISPTLLNQVWSYVCVLWNNQYGNHFPTLLKQAPYYLRERIKLSLYEFHIQNNSIFSNCHSDFIRQLVTTLKQYTFYPGNYITFEGDIDGSMYFIHSGEVEVIRQGNHYAETIQDILKDGEIFGIIQGLYPRKMHNFTYRAKTTCIILVLNYQTWRYLLPFFPSTKANLYENARSL